MALVQKSEQDYDTIDVIQVVLYVLDTLCIIITEQAGQFVNRITFGIRIIYVGICRVL